MDQKIRNVLANAASTIKYLEQALHEERLRTKMFDDIMTLHNAGKPTQGFGMCYPTSTSDIEELVKEFDEAEAIRIFNEKQAAAAGMNELKPGEPAAHKKS